MSLLDNLLQLIVLNVKACVSLTAWASHINEHSRVTEDDLWSERIMSLNPQLLIFLS